MELYSDDPEDVTMHRAKGSSCSPGQVVFMAGQTRVLPADSDFSVSVDILVPVVIVVA
ncbi:unnamed protein product [Dovyalis caffra]|uniref:Uncharacterized protein n=1 Tax=Dovyalis caffra TaxID=77055 RepID=A0AAV1RPZ9_9ROSI|nr:unnamed protein product [Dovyalis caffra]